MKTLRRLNLSVLQSAVISDAEQVMLLGGSYAAPASANCVCTLVGNPPCGTTTNEVLNKP